MLSKKEFGRQTLHILVGLITATFYYYEIFSTLAIFLIVIIGLLASILSKRISLPIFSYFLDKFERDNVRNKFPGKGMVFFFIGVLFVIQLFEKDIALAAIMILTLGDSISHIFGAKFGQLQNIFNGKSKKLFEGTLAGTIAGFLGAMLFVPYPEAFLASFAAMIGEVIKIDLNDNTLDDNLVVPLVAGTTIFLLRRILG